MHLRKLTVAATLVATALATPVVATADVAPDPAWGSGGSATLAVECHSGFRYHFPQAAYGGRFYELQACAADYYRLIRLGADGKIEKTYGVNGRVTLHVPSRCTNWIANLAPAPDGSLYLAFGGVSGNAVTGGLNQYTCLARITAAGKQVPTFGGSTPYRRLDRIGHANGTTIGTAIDRGGRLLVFTENGGYNLEKSTVFINRYLVSGKPDLTFSSDGQRTHTEAHQRRFISGGVVGNNPVIAVASSNNDLPDRSGFGTAFVRFTIAGARDTGFGASGRAFVRDAELGGARAGRFVVDGVGRIVFVATFGDRWFDLQRLSKSGVRDTAFGAATTRISGSGGSRVFPGLLAAIHNHYLVSWSGKYGQRLTGFESTGGRWTAVGPGGTAQTEVMFFAPDEVASYDAPNAVEITPEPLVITRSTVQ